MDPTASPGAASPSGALESARSPSSSPVPSSPSFLPAERDPGAPLGPRKVYALYTPELAQTILDLYVDGSSLRRIAALGEPFPSYNGILRWIRDNSHFREQLALARMARAFHFEEEALELAGNGKIDKDDVAGERLRFDILRWAAETGAPETFGKKVTVAGDAKRPIIFKVMTGVPAPALGQATPPRLAADGTVIPTTGYTVDEAAIARDEAVGALSANPEALMPLPEGVDPIQDADSLKDSTSSAMSSELLERLAKSQGVAIPDDPPPHEEGALDGQP